jgi:hypothetical protein
VSSCYPLFIKILNYYATTQLIQFIELKEIKGFAALKKTLQAKRTRTEWLNIGGQLIREDVFLKFRKDVNSGKIRDWDGVHAFYEAQGRSYAMDKFDHAMAVWDELTRRFEKHE